MSENPTVYEKAVTTDRSAEVLANRHGFGSVAQLAESLPQGAQVLDVGAGASPFGRVIAALRPDITWTNFDYSYRDPAILADVSRNVPLNVQYVPGDATKLDEVYTPETFDAVFSYWLFPHLSIDDPEPAEAAAKAIFAVTKPGGLMSVGPKFSQRSLVSLKSGRAIQVVKDAAALDADSYAELIITKTKLPKISRHTQRMANEVATSFFGTTRYTKREGRIPHIYDPETGDYIRPFTRRGLRIVGSLAVSLARHAWRMRRRSGVL